MSNKINNKTLELQNLKKIIRLTEDERRLFYKMLETNGHINYKELSYDEQHIMEKIHNKGICSKGNEDYVLNSDYNSLK